jgi:chaperone modulatory protein CbpM
MDTHGFLRYARLDAEILATWIEAGWLAPRQDSEGDRFSEIDIARAQLICELKQDMGVNDEGIAIILHLVDQMHGLRGTLREIFLALGAQPEAMRRKIVAGMRDRPSDAARSDDESPPGPEP